MRIPSVSIPRSDPRQPKRNRVVVLNQINKTRHCSDPSRGKKRRVAELSIRSNSTTLWIARGRVEHQQNLFEDRAWTDCPSEVMTAPCQFFSYAHRFAVQPDGLGTPLALGGPLWYAIAISTCQSPPRSVSTFHHDPVAGDSPVNPSSFSMESCQHLISIQFARLVLNS